MIRLCGSVPLPGHRCITYIYIPRWLPISISYHAVQGDARWLGRKQWLDSDGWLPRKQAVSTPPSSLQTSGLGPPHLALAKLSRYNRSLVCRRSVLG